MTKDLVYVLDDDPDLAGSVARLLRRHGYDAESFIDPESLLQAYPEEAARCVISDVMMPQMNGFDFADRLKEIDPLSVIIFMTAWATPDDAVKAMRAHGGYDYIAKPLSEQRLLEAVADAIARSKRRNASSH